MRVDMISRQIIKLTALSIFVLPSMAHAYTDPGSGLLLWQLMGSFFIGLLFYVKKIVTFLKGLFRRNATH
jgi:hypothetical protein